MEIARQLGLDSTKEIEVKFLGVGNDLIKGFLGAVELRIGGSHFQTQVIFAEISDFGHGILGHKGFFDHFDVNLKYQDQIIEVEVNSF